MKAAIEQMLARLRDQNVEVPADEVESRMRLLVETFGIISLRNSKGSV